jgi:alpha-L-fucosidase
MDERSHPGEWFDEARFGMFVHWDHASQRGLEVSWPLVGGIFSLPFGQSVPAEEYHALADSFDPQRWDPAALATSAKRAGMGYGVFTTKHHNGFALFPSAHGDHSVARTLAGRDLVGEWVDAFRAEGLRIGLYFSLSDWHHPDYPAWTDDLRPYRLGSSPPLPSRQAWSRYRRFLLGQLDELLTGYGRIDVVWFDGGWERPSDWWGVDEIAELIRSRQPGCLINDRLPGRGDFATPEQFIPATPPAGRWESCLTMNDSWGWNPTDTGYKTPRAIVHALCETAGRGGNLLLNVSPTGDGSLPPEQQERLAVLAEWMGRHAEAIRGTGPGLEPWQFYGPSTRRAERTYLFLLSRPYDTVTVRGVPIGRIRSVADVASGRALSFRTTTGILERLGPDPIGELVITVPEDVVDPYATVLAVDIDGPTP